MTAASDLDKFNATLPCQLAILLLDSPLPDFFMVLTKKLFNRVIYHCPYCNLCRLGKGLGIDYFHCMTCNACMSRLLMKHTCREKLFMDNCPICNEDIFTSTLPVKSLPCGHLMHSTCFEVFAFHNFSLFYLEILHIFRLLYYWYF